MALSEAEKGLIRQGVCPRCGGNLAHMEGCIECPSCGWAACAEA